MCQEPGCSCAGLLPSWIISSRNTNCEALIQYLLSVRQTRTPLGVGAPGGVASAGSKLISSVVAPDEISGATVLPTQLSWAGRGGVGGNDVLTKLVAQGRAGSCPHMVSLLQP